jgi:hypothetical protein
MHYYYFRYYKLHGVHLYRISLPRPWSACEMQMSSYAIPRRNGLTLGLTIILRICFRNYRKVTWWKLREATYFILVRYICNFCCMFFTYHAFNLIWISVWFREKSMPYLKVTHWFLISSWVKNVNHQQGTAFPANLSSHCTCLYDFCHYKHEQIQFLSYSSCTRKRALVGVSHLSVFPTLPFICLHMAGCLQLPQHITTPACRSLDSSVG